MYRSQLQCLVVGPKIRIEIKLKLFLDINKVLYDQFIQ